MIVFVYCVSIIFSDICVIYKMIEDFKCDLCFFFLYLFFEDKEFILWYKFVCFGFFYVILI